MARGKYAAKAANRMANLDNELLQQSRAEVAELKSQVAELEMQLTEERRTRGSLTLSQADALSAKMVDEMRRKLEAEAGAHAKTLHGIAEMLSSHFRALDDIPLVYETKLLPILIPDIEERNAHIGKYVLHADDSNNRYVRRQGAQNIKRQAKQKMSTDNPSNVLIRKAVTKSNWGPRAFEEVGDVEE